MWPALLGAANNYFGLTNVKIQWCVVQERKEGKEVCFFEKKKTSLHFPSCSRWNASDALSERDLLAACRDVGAGAFHHIGFDPREQIFDHSA